MASDQSSSERHPVHRDWMGHGLQLVGILAVIGIPLLIWGGNVNTAVSNNTERNMRLGQDIQADRLDNRAFQTEMRTALTSLSGALAELRVQLATKDGGKR